MNSIKAIYSEDLLEEVLDELEIDSPEKRSNMRVAILNSAMVYNQIKSEYESNYQASGASKRKLDELVKPIELLTKKLGELNNASYYRIAEKLNDSYAGKDNPFYSAFISTENNKLKIYNDDFINFLEQLEKACTEISKRDLVHSAKKDAAIMGWFEQLLVPWKEYSSIYLTRGMHKAEKQYDTKAVCILEKIMKPLDPSVNRGHLGNKLEEYRKKFLNS